MTEVGETHPKDHRHNVPDSDEHTHRHLEELLHLQQAGDHIRFDGDDRHGNRVIQDDNAPFTFGLDDIHAEEFDHHFAHAHLSHGAREHAPDRSHNADHGNRHQDQSLGGVEEIVETVFYELHGNYS